jgi:hypothetical protein
MSTQRRENHSTPATKWAPGTLWVGHRRGPRNRWQRTNCTDSAGALRQKNFAPFARQVRAYAKVGTAPPHTAERLHPSDKNPSPGAPARLATNSLQSDYRTTQFVRQHIGHISRSSPPSGAGKRAATGTPATYRSSHPLISSPSAFEPLHTA